MKFRNNFDQKSLQNNLYLSNVIASITALLRRQLNLQDSGNDRIQKFWRVRGHKNPAELSIKDKRILEKLMREICAAETQISLLIAERQKVVAEYLQPSDSGEQNSAPEVKED